MGEHFLEYIIAKADLHESVLVYPFIVTDAFIDNPLFGEASCMGHFENECPRDVEFLLNVMVLVPGIDCGFDRVLNDQILQNLHRRGESRQPHIHSYVLSFGR